MSNKRGLKSSFDLFYILALDSAYYTPVLSFLMEIMNFDAGSLVETDQGLTYLTILYKSASYARITLPDTPNLLFIGGLGVIGQERCSQRPACPTELNPLLWFPAL